jgi:hypothetical protein
MEISKKLKIALDETRMLVLGVQILIGFQFRSVFQDSFDALPAWSRYLDGLATLLMVCTLGLLICRGRTIASWKKAIARDVFMPLWVQWGRGPLRHLH